MLLTLQNQLWSYQVQESEKKHRFVCGRGRPFERRIDGSATAVQLAYRYGSIWGSITCSEPLLSRGARRRKSFIALDRASRNPICRRGWTSCGCLTTVVEIMLLQVKRAPRSRLLFLPGCLFDVLFGLDRRISQSVR